MLKYEQPKRGRIKNRGFRGVSSSDNYWFEDKTRLWVHTEEVKAPACTCHFRACRSVRAFRRYLRKLKSYLPKGVEFVLVSRWVGHCVYGRT